MLRPNVVEKITTHILCAITSFFGGGGNRADFEIMWKNIV